MQKRQSSCMLVGSAYNLYISTSNDVTIESVRSQNCLGVDLDNRLAFDIHIENISKIKDMLGNWCHKKN